jgi:hypothetical protein
MGQWIKDLTAGHGTFAERLADRQNLTVPSQDPDYAAPSLGQGLNQHETATAFVIETGLVRLGQLEVLVPHFHERRLPVGREPEMDTGQAVLIGVVRALGLNGVGNKLGDNQFDRVD